VDNATLDLGHVSIYRGLVAHCSIDAELEPELFDIVQRKSLPDLYALRQAGKLDESAWQRFADLVGLNGPATILDEADSRLGGLDASIDAALASLRAILTLLQTH